MRYAASVNIAAPADAVWKLLTEAEGYAGWNSTVDRVEGDIVDGLKIKVWATISPKRAFPVKVAFVEPGRTMTWTGGMPLGLFKGVRTFTLTSAGDDTRLDMEETFAGLMLPLIARSMPNLQPSFDQFVADLKAAAEAAKA